MKTSFYFIFLLISFHAFSQDGIRAEANDTVQRVFRNGKVGLVHQDGRQILEPEYTDLRMEALGIRLYNKELQGYLPKGSTEVIPAIYKNLSSNSGYFEAQTENGTIDLYFGSELIASDLDNVLGREDILVATNLIIIRKEEKVGIIDQKGKIIVPMEYAGIETVPSFTYVVKDNIQLNYILVLDKSDYFYSPESEGFLRLGEPVLYLAKLDGTLITDSVFSEVSPNLEKDEYDLRYHEKMAVMNNRFEIDFLSYISITEFMEWKFCSTGEKTILFNRFNQVIDTFQNVVIPTKYVVMLSEDGIEMTSYYEKIYADFVYVTKNHGEESVMAIYDLRNQKIVSHWDKEITFLSRSVNTSGITVWVFTNAWETESGYVAYQVSTENKGSDYIYEEIIHITGPFYGLKKVGDSFFSLCELVQDSVFREVIQIEKAFGSLNYVGIGTLSVQEFDPNLLSGYLDDLGNYYPYSEDVGQIENSSFSTPFTIFKNTNGKLGFISWNGKVIDLNADTLFQSDKSSTLIEYRSGDLWGAAEIAWGSNFKPDRKDIGKFYLLDEVSLIYRMGDDEKHYVDSKGRVFYSVNTERTISKKGKGKGAEMYSDFESVNGENSKEVVIPFLYKELITTWNTINFQAKGFNNKWGIISAYNDTVFPFKYDQLEFQFDLPDKTQRLFPYRDYDQQCLTRIGKLQGLLSLNLRKEIPAVYNQIQYVPNAAFIVQKNGKMGVYDYYLNEKIKPVFDEIFIAASLSGVYILRAKKDGLWYNMEFFEGKVPDQTTLLQAIPCDFVINEQGYTKKGNTYEIIDLMNGSMEKKTAISELLKDSKQLKLVDEKIYLVNSKGKLLYANGLTNIVVQEDQVISIENGITYSYSLLKKEKRIVTE
jgi:hypothetical protein